MITFACMRLVKNTERTIICSVLLFTFAVLAGCNGCQKETQRRIGVKEKTAVKLQRFEKELFAIDTNRIEEGIHNMYAKYGPFYQSYARDILNMPEDSEDSLYIRPMGMLLRYPPLIQLQRTVDSAFADVSDIEKDLSSAMSVYKQEFPQNAVPRFITFISEFGYANITYDSSVCIGLDMYMNKRYADYYRAYEFPEFMIRKLQREYIVPHAIKALAISQTEQQSTRDKRFIATMIVEGKVRYFTKALLPDVHDSIIMGYTTAQLKWSIDNEPQMWTYFIEKKLLYQNEPSQFMRFFNDGPFTSADGVPPESAPSIGTWAGLQIVRNYMKLHPEVTLQQLMDETNFDKILKESKYRPGK
jgi:hypothetical protein